MAWRGKGLSDALQLLEKTSSTGLAADSAWELAYQNAECIASWQYVLSHSDEA